MNYSKIVSSIDSSVNFIAKYGRSKIECRYVRRSDDYISAYLSSHNGCTMGCKFCWLTSTNQTNFKHVNDNLYGDQLNTILQHAKSIDGDNSKNVKVNINFMARGEPLANKYIINYYPNLYNTLNCTTRFHNYKSIKMNISTILPKTVQYKQLHDIFKDYPAYIYYSLYSTNIDFRNKWMPNAIHWRVALDKLKLYQEYSNLPITIHFAIIDDENDDINDVKTMASIIDDYQFDPLKFNIVRFNPHPTLLYKEAEPEKIDEIFDILSTVSNDISIEGNKTRIVPRIGKDVYASCGMFIE